MVGSIFVCVYLSCLAQAADGGVLLWEMFSWHTLGPLMPTEHWLNARVFRNIVIDQFHHFMTTVDPTNVPHHKA